MMKKILAILLALSLLLSLAACGKTAEPDPAPEAVEPQPEPEPEPKPEPEPADPRAIWKEAEEQADNYQSVEIDEDFEISVEFAGETTVNRNSSCIQATDMNDRLAVYQIVVTGDQSQELYYRNGTAFVEDENGQYCSMMSLDSFLEYALGGPDICEDQFDTVELVSETDGWEIAFSDPRPSFVEAMVESSLPAGAAFKEDTLAFSGSLRLTEEGLYDSYEFHADGTAVLSGGQELSIALESQGTYRSINEDISLTLPEKLNNFIRVDDLEVIDALFDAAADLTQHYAADTLEQFTFEGEMAGVPVSLTKDYADGYTLDPDTQALRTHSDISLYVSAAGEEETLTYTYDFADGTITYSGSDGTSGSEALDPTDELVATLADLQAFLSKDQFYLFENLTGSEEDGTLTLSFSASDDLVFQLFYYMLTMTAPDAAASLYECTDYLPGERSGAIVIDQETGRFLSLTTEVSAEFTMPDGSSYSGTIRFEKTFRAFDGDVSLPLPDGGAAA